MIYTSLAVLALSATAAAPQLGKLVHLHPHAVQNDTRVSVTIHNDAFFFQDVRIDGHTYTLEARKGITVKAPVGTVVYIASSTGEHHRGDVLVQMSAQLDQKLIDIR
jgi:hypothetical protein